MSSTHRLHRITWKRFALFCLLLCVLQLLPAFSREPSPIALRAGPGEQQAIVATVPPTLFLALTIVEEQGEWAKVRVASGQEGWLRLGALGAGAPAPVAGVDRAPVPAHSAVPLTLPGAERPSHSGPTPPATLLTGEASPITLRAGPGEQQAIVATVPPTLFLALTIVEEQGEWAKVRVASGQEGWLRLGALGAGAPAPVAGVDRAPVPAHSAVPPTLPGAERPPEHAPTSAAPPLATATAERVPALALPRPPALPAPSLADRLPEPPPARSGAVPTPALPRQLAEQRTALVIGNAAYEREIGALQNARNDAEDMASLLRQLHFQVTLVRDGGYADMEEALRAFHEQLRQRRGVGVFYFAGHGAELDGMGYLLPVRSGVRDRWQLPYKTLSVQYVQAAMEEAGNRLNMIILDACRDIPMFAAAEKGSWGRGHQGLPSTTAGPDMLIAYATSPGQAALDGAANSRNGVYTKHLLRAMAMPGLSAEDVFRTTLRGVLEETQGKQRPWSSLSVAERFEFVPSGFP